MRLTGKGKERVPSRGKQKGTVENPAQPSPKDYREGFSILNHFPAVEGDKCGIGGKPNKRAQIHSGHFTSEEMSGKAAANHFLCRELNVFKDDAQGRRVLFASEKAEGWRSMGGGRAENRGRKEGRGGEVGRDWEDGC